MTICFHIKYTVQVEYTVYKRSKLKDTYIKIQYVIDNLSINYPNLYTDRKTPVMK